MQSGRLLVARFLASPGSSAGPYGADAMAAQLEDLRKAYDYEAVLLLDRAGRQRLGAGDPGEGLRDAIANAAGRAMRDGTIIVSRAYPDEAGGKTHLDIAAPVSDALQPGAPIVGALVLHFDPRAHLDPLLQSWPAPSESGESFIVERVEGRIAYLSSLRHADASALLKQDDDPYLPAALAARGLQGVTEGLDYRGVPVVAAVGQVPGMPWFVVAKLDRAEILAPVQRHVRISGTLTALLVLALGLILFLWQRRSQGEMTLAQETSEKRALAASEARFRKLHEHGWDIIALFDRDMIFRYASPMTDRIMGRSMVGQDISVGTARVHPDDIAAVEAARQAALSSPGIPQYFSAPFRSGHRRLVDGRSLLYQPSGRPGHRGIRLQRENISRRIESERLLRESEERYRYLLSSRPMRCLSTGTITSIRQ